MSGRTSLLLVLIVAGAALVYSVAARMSEQTIDVVVGLLCGVGASVPVSAGLLIALTRRRSEPAEKEEPAPDYPAPAVPYGGYPSRQPYPPVIVITPQQGQIPNAFGGLLPPGQMPAGYSMNEPPIMRDFRIIGQDDEFDA